MDSPNQKNHDKLLFLPGGEYSSSVPFTTTTTTTTTMIPLLLNPATKSLATDDDEFRNFRIILRWCCLDHSSPSSRLLSYAVFSLLSLALPIAFATLLSSSSNINYYYKLVQLPESTLATISFLTLSSLFRRHDLRQLFDDSAACIAGELDRPFKSLTYILLPTFSLQLAHKILFFSSSTASISLPIYLLPRSPAPNAVAFAVVMVSWVYRTGVFLLVCVLFRLTCELQISRFEGFRKLFEEQHTTTTITADQVGGGVEMMYKEHARIRRQLLVTSHRYRIFIIGCFLTITITQLGALLLLLGSKSSKNFSNSGDLLVCSGVQLSGFFMCLLGAARITHRAQGVVSIATRWHLIITTTSESSSSTNITAAPPPAATMLALETRKALVKYLQHNNGGITLFGFALDRGLLHTLFAFEMSLVLWILSKVVVID